VPPPPTPPSPTTVELNQATFDNNEQYQVSEDTTIYIAPGEEIGDHNVFFDLNKFSAVNNNATDFMIKGSINFGILVGFSENVNLYGEDDGLINLTNQDEDAYGVLVGSTDAEQDAYTGNMYIDGSVTANISSSNDAYGVSFSCVAAGSITVNGSFLITADAGDAYGVYFESTSVDSTQNINGNFSVCSSSPASFGVCFLLTVFGSTTINGNFSVSAPDYAYGVYFDSTNVASTQNISGSFSISSTGASCEAYGVYFPDTAAGSANVSGNFSISTLVSMGVYFHLDPTGARTGTPTFYSNKADSGN
jgi:hypothetical protein